MEFNSAIPHVDSTQLQYMKQVDLNDYYRDVQKQEITHCQICKLNIKKSNVFEHTISTRHKYNKLLFGIAQGRSSNVDVDFIVLNIDRLQCRYCDSQTIDSAEDDLIANHIQSTGHITKKQDYLDRLKASIGSSSDVGYNLVQPLDSSIAHTGKTTTHRNTRANRMKKKKISLEDELRQMTKESRDRNNEFKDNAIQIVTLARDYKRQKGEELPKCITVGEGGATCKCDTCHINIPLRIYNTETICDVRKHIDGTQHKTAMLQSMKFGGQEFEVNDETKPAPEPVPQLNFHTTEEIATYFREALKIGPNNVRERSTSSEDEEVQRKIESLSYFRILKHGTLRCTICRIKVPNNYRSLVGHLNSEKHAKSMQSGMELSTLEEPTPRPAVNLKIRRAAAAVNDRDTSNNGKGTFPLSSAAKVKKVKKTKDHSVEQHISSKDQKGYTVEFKEFQKSGIKDTKKSTLAFSDTSETFYKCPTCLLFIANDESSINWHNNRKRHQRKVKDLNISVENNLYLSQNNLLDCISVDKNRYSCRICNKILPRDGLIINHLNSKKHKINVTKPLVANDENVDVSSVVLPEYTRAALGVGLETSSPKVALNDKTKSVNVKNGSNRCRVNFKSIANTKQPRTKNNFKYKAHLLGKKETKLNRQEKMRESRNHFMCDICFKSVPNCKDDINHHLKGRKHRSNMLLESGEPEELRPLNLRKEDDKKRYSAISDEKKLRNFKFIKLPNCRSIRGNGLAKCKLCVSEMPNNYRDINLHVNGKRHKQAMEIDRKLIPNVISVVKNGKRSCTICLIDLRNNLNSINYHLRSEEHTQASQPSHLHEGDHRERNLVASNNKELQTGIELPDCISLEDPCIAKCTVCVADIANKPTVISRHLNSKKHKDAIKVETNFQLNFISVVKNGRRCCMLCRTEFPNNPKNLVIHMASKQHIIAIETCPQK